jgi:pimeloyl-ACP methyl ester carboxylesterase
MRSTAARSRTTALVAGVLAAALIGIGIDARAVSARSPAVFRSVMAGHPMFAAWRSRHWAAVDGKVRLVTSWVVHYVASNHSHRIAIVVLPRWYGPHDHPPIPFVISPHGRGVRPETNARLWGNLPALGRFAVVNPEGDDNVHRSYSWGNAGQISDLARMPRIVRRALPWLRIAPHRVYAIGGSMGGQETLLLLAKHPHLLAGAISFDAPTNMAERYGEFPLLRRGLHLQQLARLEFGGVPRARDEAWADRSPIFYAREIAFSGVPLEIWWSTRDRIVVDGASQSGLLYRAIKRLNPFAPVTEVVGTWHHTAEMRPIRRMPLALARMGLLLLRS